MLLLFAVFFPFPRFIFGLGDLYLNIGYNEVYNGVIFSAFVSIFFFNIERCWEIHLFVFLFFLLSTLYMNLFVKVTNIIYNNLNLKCSKKKWWFFFGCYGGWQKKDVNSFCYLVICFSCKLYVEQNKKMCRLNSRDVAFKLITSANFC